MNAPSLDQLTLSLSLPGLPELQPLARDFALRVLTLADFADPQRQTLCEAFVSSLSLLEASLAREGDPLVDLDITAHIDPVALEFRILEHGLPLGSELLSPSQTEPSAPGPGQRVNPTPAFDRLWWVQKGAAGSELHLRVHRPHPQISVLQAVEHRLTEEHAEHTDLQDSTQTGTYQIRDYQAEDGLQVARRIYEAYGRSYINPDLYVPERITQLNASGALHSIVCVSPDGNIVGHYALERPELGPTAEAGQAVIDHSHRGHGLMKPMRAAVEKIGAQLGLLGIWSLPTAMHPLSQRMNLQFGAVPSAIQLGMVPASMALRGGVAGEAAAHDATARGSTFLYWHPLTAEPPLSAHAPPALVDMLAALYNVRGRSVVFNTPNQPPPASTHAQAVHCRFSGSLGTAWVVVERVEGSTLEAVRAAVEAMINGAGAQTVYIDLPLDDPAMPAVAEALLRSGYQATGVMPRTLKRSGARQAEDALRLAIHPVAVDYASVVVEGELGERLFRVARGGQWQDT